MLTREPDAAALEAAFAPLEGAAGMLLAVSGGPDSMALMLLARQWAAGLQNPPPLFVATVDHGLRPGSDEEAAQAGRRAAALGLPHAVLRWEGVKPESGIHEKARAARYGLLCAHGRALGLSHVLTAHHADDQAETVLMRMARGSGLSGLGGMEASVARGGLVHARPLLAFPKASLVAVCDAAGQAYIEDPSNADPRFARARWRAAAPQLAAWGLDAPVLGRLAERLRRADRALEVRAREVRAGLSAREDGPVGLRPLLAQPDEISLRVLAGLLAARGGGALRLERLETLHARLRSALSAGVSLSATLGGCTVRLDARGWLSLARERPRRRGTFTMNGPGQMAAPAGRPASLGKGQAQPYIGLQDQAKSTDHAHSSAHPYTTPPCWGHETVQE